MTLNEIITFIGIFIGILVLFVIYLLLVYWNIFAKNILIIFIFYFIIDYNRKIRENEPKEPSEPIYNDETKKIERAWKYDDGADKRIQQRLNYFMVAESMLLLSFVTAYSKDIKEILIAIAIAGITITSLWFIPNIRLLIQAHILEKYLLLKDPIYYWHIRFVRCQPNTTLLIHNILPNSLIVLWAYLLSFSFLKISIFEFAIELSPFCLLILLGVRLIIKVIVPRGIEEKEVLKKLGVDP